MPHPTNENLHLPDLTIRGFRGIKDLSISRLGRVTLVAGKNGIGKTTLLEAVQVFAARGRYAILNGLLRTREELIEVADEEGIIKVQPNWSALFHGRRILGGPSISIGSSDPSRQVSIGVIDPQLGQLGLIPNEYYFDEHMLWFRVEFQSRRIEFPVIPVGLQRFINRRPEADLPPDLDCNSLGPSLPDNAEVAGFWDNVVLTDDEDLGVAALRLITDERVERVAAIGQTNGETALGHGRLVMVKIAGETTRIPLKSLGDGATRFFTLALALANSRNGFLLIDEAENGIHHSMQRSLWNMVLQTAVKNDIQVLAATHSWDCVRGFAQAVMESEEADGVLIRLERNGDTTRAIEYSEDELRVAAEQGIEVR